MFPRSVIMFTMYLLSMHTLILLGFILLNKNLKLSIFSQKKNQTMVEL